MFYMLIIVQTAWLVNHAASGFHPGTKRAMKRFEATAKIQTGKGLSVEIFSRPLRKNTTRPLTVWIVGTDIEQRLFSTGKCAIL